MSLVAIVKAREYLLDNQASTHLVDSSKLFELIAEVATFACIHYNLEIGVAFEKFKHFENVRVIERFENVLGCKVVYW